VGGNLVNSMKSELGKDMHITPPQTSGFCVQIRLHLCPLQPLTSDGVLVAAGEQGHPLGRPVQLHDAAVTGLWIMVALQLSIYRV